MITINRIPFQFTVAENTEEEIVFDPALLPLQTNPQINLYLKIIAGPGQISVGSVNHATESPTWNVNEDLWLTVTDKLHMFVKAGANPVTIKGSN